MKWKPEMKPKRVNFENSSSPARGRISKVKKNVEPLASKREKMTIKYPEKDIKFSTAQRKLLAQKRDESIKLK